MQPTLNSTPFSGQNSVGERGFIMAKYDKNFKLICINAYENKEPLPKVEGVLERSLNRYVKLWRLVYREMGERGLEDGFLQHNFTVKEK